MNYVYIVECSDQTLYTGWTTNLEKRLAEHNNGIGAKYTRSRLPVILVYHEQYSTRTEALKREYYIKKMTRQQKQELIMNTLCDN